MKRLLWVSGISALVAASAIYYVRVDVTAAPTELTFATASRGNVVSTVDATGTLQPLDTVEVGSLSGTIAAIGTDFNQVVKRGQVIATLDQALFQSQRLLGTTHVSSILVAARTGTTTTQVSAAVTDLLRRRHHIAVGDPNDFAIRSPEEMARVRSSTTNTMAYLLASVAAISLVVGGIGIMNIMLVSVTERTKEIGLRRALGARRVDVLRQFVIEALSLSLAGGSLGVVLGIATSLGLSEMLSWATRVSSVSVLMSFGFAAAVGVVFGYVPARRAAALLPTEALRYE